jgi:hypothetical protein
MTNWTDFLNNAIDNELLASLSTGDVKNESNKNGQWTSLILKRFTAKN